MRQSEIRAAQLIAVWAARRAKRKKLMATTTPEQRSEQMRQLAQKRWNPEPKVDNVAAV